jgi:hypothetical protein
MAARKTATRTTRTTRETKTTRQPAVEPAVEEGPGPGLADGLVIVTTLLLVAAILLTDYLLGKHFGRGVFFG